jgi:hypothetical protein
VVAPAPFAIPEPYRRPFDKLGYLYYQLICADQLYLVLYDWFDCAIVVNSKEIVALLRDAHHNGSISLDERLDGDRADIIAIDDGIGDRVGHLAVMELSAAPDQDDVENAARRAGIIGRASGVTTHAFAVAYYQWPDEMADLARQLGVTLIRYEAPDFEGP